MTDAAITGLIRIDRPKPNQGGSTILAWFDCEVVGFALKGCALVRTPKNGLVAWPPKIEGPEGYRRSVAITDDSIRHAMMVHAREVYQALGGTDAEWVGRPSRELDDGSIVMPVRRTRVRPDRRREQPIDDTDEPQESEGVLRFIGAIPESEVTTHEAT